MPSIDLMGDPRLEALLDRWDDLRAAGLNPSAADLTQEPELLPSLESAIAEILHAEAALGGAPQSPAAPARGVPGRFESLVRHDEGGMGVVYRAWDAELGRAVAYKVIKPQLSSDHRAVEKFLNEARVTARVQHPGVVPVHGLTSDADGRPAYAMRFVEEGVPLLEAVAQFHSSLRPKPNTRAAWHGLLNHLVRVCQTIGHAHSLGLLHRDISPRNILVAGDAETLVVDWGLAIDLKRHAQESQTADRAADAPTRAGTAPYTAPEAWESKPTHTFRSDIYSLGALLYLILTGKPPYFGKTIPEVIEKVRAGPPPAASLIRPGIPRPLAKICSRAMSRKPGERYATALELARDLEAWVAGDRVSADREPWREAVWRWTSRHPTRTTAGAFLVLLAFVGLTSASLVSAARSRTALKANEADRFREESLRTKADAYITYGLYAENLVRSRTGNPDLIAGGFLIRSLLRLLEQRDQDPLAVSHSARAFLEVLDNSNEVRATQFEADLKAVDEKLRQGISVFEELTRKYPVKRSDRVLLGRYYHMLGTVQTTPVTDLAGYEALLVGRGGLRPQQQAKLESTLALFDKALATLPPEGDDVRGVWSESWMGRAVALLQLGRITEALLAWDQFLAFADAPRKAAYLPIRSTIVKGAEIEQSRLPWSRPPRVDHVKATQMAEALANHEGVSPAAVYNAACAFSLASLDATAGAAERGRRADRAMAYLQGIAANGYFQPKAKGILGIFSKKDTLNELLTDPDLDPLRDRADFKALAATAAAKAGTPQATPPSPASTRK